jgi:hypothetical protein
MPRALSRVLHALKESGCLTSTPWLAGMLADSSLLGALCNVCPPGELTRGDIGIPVHKVIFVKETDSRSLLPGLQDCYS